MHVPRRVCNAGNRSLNIPTRNPAALKPRRSPRIAVSTDRTEGMRAAMHDIAALLATLTHIAGEPCSCDEHSSRAVALVAAYSATLYQRLGIPLSRRPTSSAKTVADQTLAELRREILAVEARSGEAARTAFTAARHRIEMARRALAGRLVEGGTAPPASRGETIVQGQRRGLSTASQRDWQILAALRRSLAEREHVARSRAAIADSLRVLEAYALEGVARSAC